MGRGKNRARPAPLIEGDFVTYDQSCVHCDYNLRTLRWDGRCPECGFPVDDSRPRPPDPTSPAAGIAALGDGVLILTAGTLLFCLYPLASVVARFRLRTGLRTLIENARWRTHPICGPLLMGSIDVAALACLGGWVLAAVLTCSGFHDYRQLLPAMAGELIAALQLSHVQLLCGALADIAGRRSLADGFLWVRRVYLAGAVTAIATTAALPFSPEESTELTTAILLVALPVTLIALTAQVILTGKLLSAHWNPPPPPHMGMLLEARRR